MNKLDFTEKSRQRIERIRKGDFTITLFDSLGNPVPHAEVELHLKRHAFLFGTAVSDHWLTSESREGSRYREYLQKNFNALVSENAMKWPQTEPEPGEFDFSGGERFLDFAKIHAMEVRGHCLFWSKEKFQSEWVKALTGEALQKAVENRLQKTLRHYAGRVPFWDLNNEMLNSDFFSSRCGEDIRVEMFRMAKKLSPEARFFTNEYSILDNDERVDTYLALIKKFQAQGAQIGGIGIQEHAAERFAQVHEADDRAERQGAAPLIPEEVWRRLDRLGETGLPIHITEVSFKTTDDAKQAEALEAFYRTAFAHPAVDAFFLWGFWERAHWLGGEACLLRADLSPRPAADVLERLLKEEWMTRIRSRTDEKGQLSYRGFYGQYELRITLPGPKVQRFEVDLLKSQPEIRITVNVDA